MSQRFQPIAGYEITGCAAIDTNLISLFGQQHADDDPLEAKTTGVFFYYADEPEEDRWAFSEVGDATGIHGCAGYRPQRQWIYVLDDGAVYVVGKGADDFEQKIVPDTRAFFSNVRALRSGEVIAVGGRRKVFLRVAADQWRSLSRDLSPDDEASDQGGVGFSDVHGFDLDEIYACGGAGDLWVRDHGRWRRIDLGTDATLRRVHCSSDGFVYVSTVRRGVYKGRGDAWNLIEPDPRAELLFESIVDFQGQVLLSTEQAIFTVDGNRLCSAKLPQPPKIKSKAHMAVGDGVLVVAGRDEAISFDGKTWTRILDAEP